MQTLNRDIRDKNFHHIYLLYGEEAFLRRSYRNRIRDAIAGGDEMNCSSFGGKGVDFAQVRDLAETLPFLAERRLIILEDTGLFKVQAQEWADYMEQLPESTVLLFSEQEVDKRGRLYKKVASLGYAAELGRQKESELRRWVLQLLGREKRQITGQAMELFLQRSGEDMEQIRSELDKLISFTEGKEGITAQDVEEICTQQTAGRIFEMLEAVAAGRERQALELYYDLLALKEPSMRILFLLARQMNQLLTVKDLMMAGQNRDGIASAMKLRPFIAGKLIGQARSFEKEELRGCLNLCVETEESVKSGAMAEKLAVELLIVRIARRKEIGVK